MEIRQLEYFLAIVESGSLSKAASVVGVVQPALSRQLRQLEEELNVQLFYRHGRGLRLTPEGEQLQTVVAPIIRDLAQVKADLREASKQPAGTITVGMPPSICAAMGAEIIAAFKARFPQVKLHLVEALSGLVNEWLAAGRIDMAIINSARRSLYIRMDYLMTVDLFLVGRRKDIDALAKNAKTFPLRKLAGLKLILIGRNHGLRRELDAAARRLKLKLDVEVEVDALSALKKLLLGGHGFSVLPHGVIESVPGQGELGYRRLVEPALRQDLMLAYSLHRPVTRAMGELARQVRAELTRALADGRLVGHVDETRRSSAEAPEES